MLIFNEHKFRLKVCMMGDGGDGGGGGDDSGATGHGGSSSGSSSGNFGGSGATGGGTGRGGAHGFAGSEGDPSPSGDTGVSGPSGSDASFAGINADIDANSAVDSSTGGNVASAPNVGNTAAMANFGHVGPDPGSNDAQGNAVGFGGNEGAEGMTAEGVAPGTPGSFGFSTSAAKAGLGLATALTGNTAVAGVIGIGAGIIGGSSLGTSDSAMGMNADGSIGLDAGDTGSDSGDFGGDTGFGGNIGDPPGAAGGGVGPVDFEQPDPVGFTGNNNAGGITPPVTETPPVVDNTVPPIEDEPQPDAGLGPDDVMQEIRDRYGYFDLRTFEGGSAPSLFAPELVGIYDDEV